jgi:hypothetical protein
LQKSAGKQQFVGSINNGPVLDMSHDNSATGDKQSIITRQEDSSDVIKGALRASGLLDFATKETNESSSSSIASSIRGEETTYLDDNWLSDLMVMNTTVGNNNVVDKQAMIEQKHGSILTPRCHDSYNDISSSSATSLLDKYLSQKNVQNQQELQEQQSTEVDTEEFDSYFNELFPDLAL